MRIFHHYPGISTSWLVKASPGFPSSLDPFSSLSQGKSLYIPFLKSQSPYQFLRASVIFCDFYKALHTLAPLSPPKSPLNILSHFQSTQQSF